MKTKNDYIALATQCGSTCTTFAGARRWLLTHPATVVPLVGLVTDLPRRAEQSIRYAADMARYRMMSDLERMYEYAPRVPHEARVSDSWRSTPSSYIEAENVRTDRKSVV